MPLIECPECKKQVSDKATKCPNCGFPISAFVKEKEREKNKPVRKKRIKLLIISLVVTFVVMAIVIGICVPFITYRNDYAGLMNYRYNDIFNYNKALFTKQLKKLPQWYKDVKQLTLDYDYLCEQYNILDSKSNIVPATEYSEKKEKLGVAFNNLKVYLTNNPDTFFDYVIKETMEDFSYSYVLHKEKFRTKDGKYYFYYEGANFVTNLPQSQLEYPIRKLNGTVWSFEEFRVWSYDYSYNAVVEGYPSKTAIEFNIMLDIIDYGNDDLIMSVHCESTDETFYLILDK